MTAPFPEAPDSLDGTILQQVIKLTNLTPLNYSKLGNNLTSPEQIFEYRRQVMERLKDT